MPNCVLVEYLFSQRKGLLDVICMWKGWSHLSDLYHCPVPRMNQLSLSQTYFSTYCLLWQGVSDRYHKGAFLKHSHWCRFSAIEKRCSECLVSAWLVWNKIFFVPTWKQRRGAYPKSIEGKNLNYLRKEEEVATAWLYYWDSETIKWGSIYKLYGKGSPG